MSKLHEVLAVEAGLSTVAEKLTKESIKTFSKENLFKGGTKVHKVFAEDQQHTVQSTVNIEVETTVEQNIQYLFDEGLAPYWDSVIQKDEANQRAVADIVIGDTVIAKNVPGTTLLGLESKLGKLLDVMQAIPTLAPGRVWVQDKTNPVGVLRDNETEERIQSRQVPDFKVLYAATDKHPAQIKEFETTEPVGKFIVTSFSGMMSSISKAALIKRLQKLIGAVKQARQRANCVEVKDLHIGKALADFLIKEV